MYFFLFKQKTAYEMRISDWSSDVCSSDLFARDLGREHAFGRVTDLVLGEMPRPLGHQLRQMRLEFGHAVAAACRDEEGLIKRNALVELGRDRQQLVLLGQIDLVEDEEFLLGTPPDPLQHRPGPLAEFGRGPRKSVWVGKR